MNQWERRGWRVRAYIFVTSGFINRFIDAIDTKFGALSIWQVARGRCGRTVGYRFFAFPACPARPLRRRVLIYRGWPPQPWPDDTVLISRKSMAARVVSSGSLRPRYSGGEGEPISNRALRGKVHFH